MKKRLYLLLIFILFFSACKDKPGVEARKEIIDGIEFIFNTETPLYPKRTLSFEEELALDPEDDEVNTILFRPSSFVVGPNENIYITDEQDRAIKVFDPNGKYKLTIGRLGQGPGEFQRPGYQAFLPDGRFLVMDSGQKRTSLFDSSGEFLESFKWEENLGLLYLVTNSSLILRKYTFGEKNNPFDALEDRKLFIKEYDFEGSEINSFGEFKDEKTRILTIGRAAVLLAPPYPPMSIFAGDFKRQQLYHMVNNEYIIEVYDRTGKVIRKIERPYEPVPFTRQDAQEFTARYEEGSKWRKALEAMSMPKVKTITTRMLIDDMGNLWVETFEKKEEENRVLKAYDIFNADGSYEAKVWLDKDPAIIYKEKMYLMETDEETGFSVLKRYRLVWKE